MDMFRDMPPFLLIIIGLFVGIIIMIIFNYIKGIIAAKNVENLLEKAKNDAEKMKKDFIAEAKAEAQSYKADIEKKMKNVYYKEKTIWINVKN